MGSTCLQRPSSIPARVSTERKKSQDAGLRGQDNLLDGTHHRPHLITLISITRFESKVEVSFLKLCMTD